MNSTGGCHQTRRDDGDVGVQKEVVRMKWLEYISLAAAVVIRLGGLILIAIFIGKAFFMSLHDKSSLRSERPGLLRTPPHQMKRGVPLGLDAVMVAVHAVERPVWRAAFLLPSAAHGPQVDSQGLAFLIEMTPLQPQRLGGIRHALMVAFQLRQDLLTLESVRALGQRAGLRRGGGVGLDRKSTRLNSSHLGISYA